MLYMSKVSKEHEHIFAQNLLNIQQIFNLMVVLENLDLELSNHTTKCFV